MFLLIQVPLLSGRPPVSVLHYNASEYKESNIKFHFEHLTYINNKKNTTVLFHFFTNRIVMFTLKSELYFCFEQTYRAHFVNLVSNTLNNLPIAVKIVFYFLRRPQPTAVHVMIHYFYRKYENVETFYLALGFLNTFPILDLQDTE